MEAIRFKNEKKNSLIILFKKNNNGKIFNFYKVYNQNRKSMNRILNVGRSFHFDHHKLEPIHILLFCLVKINKY